MEPVEEAVVLADEHPLQADHFLDQHLDELTELDEAGVGIVGEVALGPLAEVRDGAAVGADEGEVGGLGHVGLLTG